MRFYTDKTKKCVHDTLFLSILFLKMLTTVIFLITEKAGKGNVNAYSLFPQNQFITVEQDVSSFNKAPPIIKFFKNSADNNKSM